MPREQIIGNHPDPTSGRIFPIAVITPETVSVIPLGSEVVLVHPSGEVEAAEWDEESSTEFLDVIRAQPDAAGEAMMFYLPPLVSVQFAVAYAMVEHGGVLSVFHRIKSGSLTQEAFVAILSDVASVAQKEVLS